LLVLGPLEVCRPATAMSLRIFLGIGAAPENQGATACPKRAGDSVKKEIFRL